MSQIHENIMGINWRPQFALVYKSHRADYIFTCVMGWVEVSRRVNFRRKYSTWLVVVRVVNFLACVFLSISVLFDMNGNG